MTANTHTAALDRPTPSDQSAAGVRWRWWGLAGGIVTGVVDTLGMVALGVTFQMNGHDVTWLVGGYFASSFAGLGFLLGYVVERRRRERLADALIRSQMETIHTARARLAQSEKLAALGQLAAQIAHEVRNPLAVIRSAAQGLGEAAPPQDAEALRAAQFITAEIDRLNSVITSLLAFARPPQLQPHPVAVGDLFDRALLLARDELAAKQVCLQRQEPVDLPAVNADPDLISQVLLGLLANAAEAVPPGGEVKLQARAVDGAVEMDVTDSGPGVSPELRERIFEPFFTTRARGTGLGLAIAKQIVEAHAGRIALGDHRGGARFTVRLPIANGSALAA